MADRHFFSIRLLVPLPVLVDGGLTRWRISFSYFGKNGGRAEIVADCVSDRCDPIVFASGRAREMEGRLRCNGIYAERGTLGHRILAKLVREGRAETVDQRAEDLAC